MKHTPIPWKVGSPRRHNVSIVTGDAVINARGLITSGRVIAVGLSHENAEFVVRACNAHAALVEAVKVHMAFLDSLPDGWLSKTTGDVGLLNDAYLASRKALKLVKE